MTEKRLSELFVRSKQLAACSADNVLSCVPLIGRCTLMLASSPRAEHHAVVSIVCYYRLPFVYIARSVIVFDKSLLWIYLSTFTLSNIDVMSNNRLGESDADPMAVESSGSSRALPDPRVRG